MVIDTIKRAFSNAKLLMTSPTNATHILSQEANLKRSVGIILLFAFLTLLISVIAMTASNVLRELLLMLNGAKTDLVSRIIAIVISAAIAFIVGIAAMVASLVTSLIGTWITNFIANMMGGKGDFGSLYTGLAYPRSLLMTLYALVGVFVAVIYTFLGPMPGYELIKSFLYTSLIALTGFIAPVYPLGAIGFKIALVVSLVLVLAYNVLFVRELYQLDNLKAIVAVLLPFSIVLIGIGIFGIVGFAATMLGGFLGGII